MFGLGLQQVHGEDGELPGVRVGVHLGEVTEKAGPDGTVRVEGLAVDLAARIQGLARPGQVLMSSSVYQSARQRLGAEMFGQPLLWRSYGDYAVKGFDDPLNICEAGIDGLSPLQAPRAGDKARPVGGLWGGGFGGRQRFLVPFLAGIVVVGGIGLAFWLGGAGISGDRPADLNAPITAIAVLPFENLMNDPAQAYFVDGMTEAITAELAKIKALKVISRTSAMRYKNTKKSAPEIAAELGVGAIVQGSIRKGGDEVQIVAQLIHGVLDEHLWGDSYVSTLKNVLHVQGEVALAVAASIHASLTPDEEAAIRDVEAVNPEAYEAYLFGKFQSAKRTREGLEASIDYFDRAIALNPNYALAHAGLADSYNLLASWGFDPMANAFQLAARSARSALALDPELPAAHMSLAWVHFFHERDWAVAEAGFRRAIELGPNDATAHQWYGEFLTTQRRFDEATASLQRALELDPLSTIINASSGWQFMMAGRFEEAVGQSDRALELDPSFRPALLWGVYAAIEAGRFEAALEVSRLHAETLERFPEGDLLEAETLAAMGDTEAAHVLLERYLELTPSEDQNELKLARVHVRLGERDPALDYIEEEFSNPKNSALNWLAADPIWDPLHDHPRFGVLLERLNFSLEGERP